MQNEVINDLLGYENIKIVQNKNYFNFSLDSILVPNFCLLNKKVKKIIDIGCGNCPISMILSQKTDAKITAVEIQEEIYDLAKKTLKINNLDKRIELINDDIMNYSLHLQTDCYDLIVSNPPYFKINELSQKNNNEIKSIARHELKLDLDKLFKVSKKLLKNGASLVFVHRTERLSDIINLLKENNLEPKRLRFIYPKNNTCSNMILIEAIKNARPGIKVLSPLITHNNDGTYTDEIISMFS